MATLSRVLPDPEGEVQAVTWRTSGSRADATPGSRPIRPPTAPESRPAPAAASAELEAQVHQQLQVAFESGVREGEAATRQQLEGEVRRAAEQLAAAAS